MTADAERLPRPGCVTKPPLGMTPRFLDREGRLLQVLQAIDRYEAAGRTPPVSWLEEVPHLVVEVRRYSRPKRRNPGRLRSLWIRWRFRRCCRRHVVPLYCPPSV